MVFKLPTLRREKTKYSRDLPKGSFYDENAPLLKSQACSIAKIPSSILKFPRMLA